MREIDLRSVIIIFAAILVIAGCDSSLKNQPKTLFREVKTTETQIDFINKLEYTETLNPYTFRSFYNGSGVGLGDFNNDGLLDIFFAGNLVSNKLYINRGNFKFQDATEQSGLASPGIWSTGVSIVDINYDGKLDIYLCKSGPPGGQRRRNELFVNNGDLTFTEKAHEYGLDFEGLSVQAAFFDYDNDGDLDCYLLNNSIRSVGGFDLRKDQRTIPDPEGGNRLLRNDNDKFVDVSQQAGIYSSKIGFGLGVTVSDLNKDGWPDLYVSNDFFERDYLYINNHNGTFSESLEEHVREISLGSMGADVADINNDGLPEIFVTEMLPEHDERLKTTSQFENWDKHKLSIDQGYYRQFSRNSLQLNNGDGTFSEISRMAGTHATDWSWGALIFDMDNDGLKDIFVANGIYKDLINQDYVNFIANPHTVREILRKEKMVIKRLVDSIPSNKLPNYAFRNNGDLTFSNKAEEWGLGIPSHSNGSSYGDLDNDGDLDLVLNNINMPALIYENQSKEIKADHSTLVLQLTGEGKNSFAIGSKVHMYDSGHYFYQEIFPMRGFMSSVDYRLLFGVGKIKEIDSIIVEWPDGRFTRLGTTAVNQVIKLHQKDAISRKVPSAYKPVTTHFSEAELKGVNFTHRENDFVDFDRDRLLFNMTSNEGPCLCVGDINNDRRDDFYIGGASGQPGSLFVQTSTGAFTSVFQSVFEADKDSEDTDCTFFDVNGDGLQDLYVTSGGNEFSSSSAALLDRLYINHQHTFSKSDQSLPVASSFESTSTVSSADFDGDGDVDLFVGARLLPFYYGLPANGFILANDGKGRFTDITNSVAPGLNKLGLITDADWADINGDQRPDLVVVGEWNYPRIFINEQGRLTDRSKEWKVDNLTGWYHSIAVGDFNKDSKVDIVVGNHGLNSRFKASQKEPITLTIGDFDQNGNVEHILSRFDNGKNLPLVLRNDLVMQIPSLKKKYLKYDNYKNQAIGDIFSGQQLANTVTLEAREMASMVLINTDSGFYRMNLPMAAQVSPVYAVHCIDIDEDGNLDIVVGGNLYRAKPETGIYDASYGTTLMGDGKGNFKAVASKLSGILVKGEIRGMKNIVIGGRQGIIIARNNLSIVFLVRNSEK